MICSILLLLSLTSCVFGAFVVNVTQTLCQAEENHNITLEWVLKTKFAGRVRCDKDVLKDGQIRLHMSRLRIDDSGQYMCEVHTGYGRSSKICHLNVTAAADEPKPPTPTMRLQPERPPMRPQPESRGRIGLHVGLTAALPALFAVLYFAFCLTLF